MSANTQPMIEDLPNGPVAAALVAGGIGAAAMGVITTLSEAVTPFADSLNWWKPAGPLTGKVIVSVVVFFVSWIVLHVIFQGKNVNFARVTTIALVLLGVGLLGTFPPFFDLFVKP